MAAPATLFLTTQRTLTDCAIAALAMVLGLGYEQVRERTIKLIKNFEEGLTSREIARVAKSFKRSLKVIDKMDDDTVNELVGLMVVRRGNVYHALVLFHGVLYDPSDGTLWEPSAYFHTTKRTPFRLLVP